MNTVASTTIKIVKDSRAGLDRVTFSTVVDVAGDTGPRECKVRLKQPGYYGASSMHFDFCPHASGGMAYKEVLTAYAELFQAAARFVEGPELDFQI